MESKNPLDLSIEIINPGNGLPGISPCAMVAVDLIGGGGGGCDAIYLCPQTYMPVCTLKFLGR